MSSRKCEWKVSRHAIPGDAYGLQVNKLELDAKLKWTEIGKQKKWGNLQVLQNPQNRQTAKNAVPRGKR